jgi:hypothetical protein
MAERERFGPAQRFEVFPDSVTLGRWVALTDDPTIGLMARLSESARSACRFFAFYLANGTLAPDILSTVDYRPALVEFGSALEMAFAIFTNVLEFDDGGKAINESHAMRRAAQWIRSYCDPLTSSIRHSRSGRRSSHDGPLGSSAVTQPRRGPTRGLAERERFLFVQRFVALRTHPLIRKPDHMLLTRVRM